MSTELNLSQYTGLSSQEVQERLKENGYNELPSTRQKGIWAILWQVVQEPMFVLLIAVGGLYLFLGELQDAVILLSSVGFIIFITFYQEQKTERALEALRDLSSPRAMVIRDGEEKRIPGREVVPGDIMILSEGDRVAADGVVLANAYLSVDESLLTGESQPVSKSNWDRQMTVQQPGGDNLPFVYSGTLVVEGQAVVEVKRTGLDTEMGKIGKRLKTLEEDDTLLNREINRLIRVIASVGLFLCALVVFLYGFTRSDWVGGFLAGLTLAIAILPEEFPVVFAVFMALGAWRISRNNVLARQAQAIETLGAATVLCVDKTGTITQNRMSVKQVFTAGTAHIVPADKPIPQPEPVKALARVAALACKPDAFDPMEKALKQFAESVLDPPPHTNPQWQPVHEYPLTRQLLAMSMVWRAPQMEGLMVAAKGAPEAIAELCRLPESERKAVLSHVESLAREGLRVLGVAKAALPGAEWPETQREISFEYLGLVGFADPIRATVPDAIQACYRAGVRVIVITGDYPLTAQSIAREIGLENPDNVVTGSRLEEMDPAKMQAQLKTVNIFARVVPEQKLRLVEVLQKQGHVVAMTGDGVNDAPALKASHIGVAMGQRGTDVARETADLVLLDDDFSSIVAAIAMGRRIFDNLRKAMAFLVAVHVPIAGMALMPIVLHAPLIFFPIHVVFLEFIIDPACSLVFESEKAEENVMDRPPRGMKEPVFGKKVLLFSLFQGLIVLGAIVLLHVAALGFHHTEEDARTLSFTMLVLANLALILTNRSWRHTGLQTLKTPNKAMWWVYGGAIVALFLALYVPQLRGVFHFSVLHDHDWLLIAGGLLTVSIALEALKQIYQRYTEPGS